MSDQSQPAEGEQAPAEATPQETAPSVPAPDFDRIYERMDQMSAQQQAMADQLGGLFEPLEDEPEPEYFDDAGQYTEDGVRAVIADYVDERLNAALAPREQAELVERRDDDWEALKASYPDLEDRDTATQAIADAMKWAQAHNPDLIDRPEFVDVIEWVYVAQKYGEHAAAQQQSQPNRVVLESASGAAQDTKGSQIDWGERIQKAAERLRPQI